MKPSLELLKYSCAYTIIILLSFLLTGCWPLTKPPINAPLISASSKEVETDSNLTEKEAPMLAELVRAHELPPVQQRLPIHPLVIKPDQSPGFYGGIWHTMVDSPDLEIFKLIGGYAPLLRWNSQSTGLTPGTAESWKFNKDGTVLTLSLRPGLKWSDGVPFTSADIGYWASLCQQGKLQLTFPWWSLVNGKAMQVQTPDQHTVIFKFAGPNWLAPFYLATGYWWCDDYNTPKHYLKQFDPTYNAAYTDYNELFRRNASQSNPARPTLWPWKLDKIEGDGTQAVFVRNPYYYMVDPLGRQLPYIDRVVTTYVQDPQVRVLKILAGEIDAQFRLVDLQDLSLYQRGMAHGNYHILQWTQASGAETAFILNWSAPDPDLRALIRKPQFRRALSIAIDRDKCNEVAWRGLAQPQQATISPLSWHFQDEQGHRLVRRWMRAWAEYDIQKANRWLDLLGLQHRDAAGYRVLANGKRLTLSMDLPPERSAGPQLDEALIVADGWRQLGIEVLTHNWSNVVFAQRQRLGQYTVSMHGVNDIDLFTYPDWVFPTTDQYWHPKIGLWYKTAGKKGERPVGVMKQLIDIYDAIKREKNSRKAHQLVQAAVRIHLAQGPFMLGTAANPPAIVIIKNNFHNVPRLPRILGCWAVVQPAASYPETFYLGPEAKTVLTVQSRRAS